MAVPTVRVADQSLAIVAATPIQYDFPLKDENEVEVIYGKACHTAVLGADYAVTLAADYLSFTITPTAALVAKIDALIVLDATEINYITVRRTQSPLTEANSNDIRLATFLLNEIERLHMHVSELWEASWRTLSFKRKNVGTPQDAVYVDNLTTPGATLVVGADGASIDEGTTLEEVLSWKTDAEAARDVAITQANAAIAARATADGDAIATAADRVVVAADKALVVGYLATAVATAATIAGYLVTAAAYVATALGYKVDAAASAAASLADRLLAQTAKTAADADVVLTHADVVLTHLDVVSTHADVVLTHADVVLTGVQAALAAVYAAALVGTSTDAVAIGTGAKVFTTQAGKQWAAGQFMTAVSAADNTKYMHGQVTTYVGTALTLNVLDVGGAGSPADWNLAVSGTRGTTGPSGTADISVLSVATVDGAADYFLFLDATDATNKKALGNTFISTILEAFTTETGIDTADRIPIYDASEAAYNKATVNNIHAAVNTFTAETAVDTADVVGLYDSSAGTMDKATINNIFKAYTTFTALTAVDTADVLPVYDTSATTMLKATVNEIFKGINTFTSLTAVDTADTMPIYDVSATTMLKATVNEIFKGFASFTAETAVDTADSVPLYDTSAATADRATVNNLFKAVSTFASETAVDVADILSLYDNSAATADKCTVQSLWDSLNTLVSDANVAAADTFAFYDASEGAANKLTINDIAQYVGIKNSSYNSMSSTTNPSAATIDLGFTALNYRQLIVFATGMSCATASRKLMAKLSQAATYGNANVNAKSCTTATWTDKISQISLMDGVGSQIQAAAETADLLIIVDNYMNSLSYVKFSMFLKYAIGGTPVFLHTTGYIATTANIDGCRLYWSATGVETESGSLFDGAGTATAYAIF